MCREWLKDDWRTSDQTLGPGFNLVFYPKCISRSFAGDDLERRIHLSHGRFALLIQWYGDDYLFVLAAMAV
jgi:hypothetical protein